MIGVTLYITACSMRNRMRRWVRRLREPRYLLGFFAALAYFYFTVIIRLRAGSSRRRLASSAALPFASAAAPVVGSMALLLGAALSWLVPTTGQLLQFSPAEVQFLYPAPVSRRVLLLHRLIRAQVGLLIASLIPALAFALPTGSGTTAVRMTLAIWVLLVGARIYFSGLTLARSSLRSTDPRLRRLARLPLLVTLAALFVVGRALFRAFMSHPLSSPDDLVNVLVAAGNEPGARVALWPFLTFVRPFLTADWTAYFVALAGGIVISAIALVWVIASDEVFQGSVPDIVELQQSRPQQGKAYSARGSDWTLAPTGRAETAFVWKSTMQMLRAVDRRIVLRLILIVATLAFLITTINRARGVAAVVGLFAAVGAAYTTLLAPQILRIDLRQDLQHLELMKTWPVRAAAVVRGEMLGPSLVLTAGAWILIGLAWFLSNAAFARTSLEWRIAIAASAMFVAPALIFAQYAIHNGLALLFPAWVPLGTGRPRGLEAMGQRLLTLGGTWLALLLMAAPGAIVGGILWFAFYRYVGPAIVVPGAAAGAAIIVLEILLMTEALGPAYEQLDLMSVERPD